MNSSKHKQRRSRSKHHSKRSRTNDAPPAENYNLLECRLKALESMLRDSQSQGGASSSSARKPTQTAPGPSLNTSRRDSDDVVSREQQPRSSVMTEQNSSRFVGRFELIPEFNGSSDGLTIDRWLKKINSISNLYHWDDSAKIFCMIARLKGNAQSWYECQTATPTTWDEWVEKLLHAFPPHTGIASKLKDFVNTERRPDQDVISFYYEKLRVGRHCNLPDNVITEIIISTMNNNLIKASAHAANCKSTDKLLEFLTDSDYVSTRRDLCQIKQNENMEASDTYSKQPFQPFENKPSDNFRNKINSSSTQLKCSYCQKLGHIRDMCYKLKAQNNFEDTPKKK